MTEEFENTTKKPINIGLVLSIAAIIGILILFALEFTDSDDQDENLTRSNMPVIPAGSNSIVFVNSDLLLHNYELVTVLNSQLENERNQKDADFTSKQQAYEQDAAYFQDQVQKQTISESSAQQIYEKLMQQQQDLYKLQDQYSAELSKKEYEMNIILLDSIKNYLSRINKIYNYDYILSYNTAGNIFFAKDTFDITSQVLEGLNHEYREKNNLVK
jgi:outer membrane protein